MFSIIIEDMYWLRKGEDDPRDFCAHGDVAAQVGQEKLYFENAAVNATGLYLLRSIFKDYLIGGEINKLISCCGFSMFANETLTEVLIIGCDNGIEWEVMHEGETVLLKTEQGEKEQVSLQEYTQVILKFVASVENFYEMSAPKEVESMDEMDKKGYISFWNEWNSLKERAVRLLP